MPKIIALTLVMSLSLTSQLAYGDEATERAQAIADTRQGLLKVVVSYFGPIVGMAREQIPFDAEVIKNNAEKISTLLPMIPDVFRNDTSAHELDTEALDDIWENMDDFKEKAATSTERAKALAAAAASGDQGATMKAFGALGGSCKGCHDNYRQQD